MFKASIDAEHESQGSVTALESSWVMVDKRWVMDQVCQGSYYTLLQAPQDFGETGVVRTSRVKDIG
jgi:hypothetical protein